jgi:hypothetical protein
MIECAEHRGEVDAMASCPRCLILYWESRHNALRAENERLRKREATLFEMVKRCERDVQRALRDANNQGHVCGYRTACEAIQQRAAGIAAEGG